MTIDLRSLLVQRLREAATLWARDLRAHRSDLLTSAPEGSRSAADIAWECIVTNRRLATRLGGGTPPPLDGFPTCPSDQANVSSLVSEMSASIDELVAAAGDDMEREVIYPGGSESVFSYAEFAAIHMMYHLGQVNYIQTLYGDPAVHWGGE